MSSFLRALAKVGLVELDESDKKAPTKKSRKASPPGDIPDEDEIERILRETRVKTQAAAEPAAEAPPDPPPRAEPPPASPPPRATPASAPTGAAAPESSLGR